MKINLEMPSLELVSMNQKNYLSQARQHQVQDYSKDLQNLDLIVDFVVNFVIVCNTMLEDM